jgi:GNAT superfamily N-acetyltransferase
MDGLEFTRAGISDVGFLLPLVEEYHRFEGIDLSPDIRRAAIETLLADPALGGIWLIRKDRKAIGYIALCYGYSIEFAGRDAFIDEFYLLPEYRRQGIGSCTLDFIKAEARNAGIGALHLEVNEENAVARVLYERHGFDIRHKFHLMSVRSNLQR